MTLPAFSQKKHHDSYQTYIDTISNKGDSLFAKLCFFQNDTLFEEGTGYLIPERIEITYDRLYKKLFNIFKKHKKHIDADRIVWDGILTRNIKNDITKVIEFKMGKIINIKYYQKGNVISDYDFNIEKGGIRDGPSDTSREYLIQGTKKIKTKNKH